MFILENYRKLFLKNIKLLYIEYHEMNTTKRFISLKSHLWIMSGVGTD